MSKVILKRKVYCSGTHTRTAKTQLNLIRSLDHLVHHVHISICFILEPDVLIIGLYILTDCRDCLPVWKKRKRELNRDCVYVLETHDST